ncbi:MAG: hypothetical protein WAL47_09355 [Pyrinomonadaceae bacterium]
MEIGMTGSLALNIRTVSGSDRALTISDCRFPIVDWPVTNESSQIGNWQLRIGKEAARSLPLPVLTLNGTPSTSTTLHSD